MPEWHCRVAAAGGTPGRCRRQGHRECGLRYEPGEYALSPKGITVPDIGTVRMDGAAFAPKGCPVILYRDGKGWAVEFEVEK